VYFRNLRVGKCSHSTIDFYTEICELQAVVEDQPTIVEDQNKIVRNLRPESFLFINRSDALLVRLTQIPLGLLLSIGNSACWLAR